MCYQRESGQTLTYKIKWAIKNIILIKLSGAIFFLSMTPTGKYDDDANPTNENS